MAEVSVNKKGKLVIHRIDCVIDAGRYVNPDTLKVQVEGCVIKGISITTSEEVTFSNGEKDQSNFDNYQISKLKDTPIINVRIVDSGVGLNGADAGLPPTLPAISNTIFSATGKCFRCLPIGKQKLV